MAEGPVIHITINVRDGYTTTPNVINKQISTKSYEDAVRLVGKVLQHLPKESQQ